LPACNVNNHNKAYFCQINAALTKQPVFTQEAVLSASVLSDQALQQYKYVETIASRINFQFYTKTKQELETVSIAEPLQNRQHAQNP